VDTRQIESYYVNIYSHKVLMALEKLNSEARQEQYAEAALDLIAVEGLKGLSVAAVARRVGLVPSALYRHFRNKEALLDSVIDLIRGRLHANAEMVCKQTSDALQRLQFLLMAHISVIRENKGILRVVFSDELQNGYPERKAQVWEMVSGYLKRVADIISQGQKEGKIRKDIDPDNASVMFLGLIQPAAILWNLSGGRFDVTRHIQKTWPIFHRSLKKE
ncbi:MAG: TetR/AcrR family transcriptional regulator, partial [Acidobacteriota bacterium]